MGPTLAAFEPIHDLPAPSETWRGCSEYDIYQYFDLVTDTIDEMCMVLSDLITYLQRKMTFSSVAR